MNSWISFPNLNIRLPIDPVAFTLGSLSVRWYGIIIAGAIVVALLIALRDTRKFGISEDTFVDMFLIALPVAVICARLFYVAVAWRDYVADPIRIFHVWEGGLAIFGVLIGAIVSVVLFSRHRRMNVWTLPDFTIVYLPLAQAIGRWGNFTNQELYGFNTTLPWGMSGSLISQYPYQGVDGSLPVHPTFLYESLLNLCAFALLLTVRRRAKHGGQVFGAYLMTYASIRFIMELFRRDEFYWGGFRAYQVMAVCIFLAGLTLFVLRRKAAPSFVYDSAAAKVVPGTMSETPVRGMPAGKEEKAESSAAPSAYADVLKHLHDSDEAGAAAGKADDGTDDAAEGADAASLDQDSGDGASDGADKVGAPEASSGDGDEK